MYDELQSNIDQLQQLFDEEVKDKQTHLSICKKQQELIKRQIQNRIRQGDEKQIMRMMKQFSQLNKRIQEMEYSLAEEHISLISEQPHDQIVEFQIFEEDTQQRKRRLQNIHRNLSNVKNMYDKISQITQQQIEQLFSIETNFSDTCDKTNKASQEVMKTQQSRNLCYRFIAIGILGLIVFVLFLK